VAKTRRGKEQDDLLKYVMVGIGGFIGAIARFWLGSYIGTKMGTRFPYGTFVINISGSFLIGLILTFLSERTHLDPSWHYLVPVGFIGAYTTFSTFEYETLRTVQDGQFLIASLNVTLSVLLGFAAVWAGAVAGRAIP
jgi:CrcB protein